MPDQAPRKISTLAGPEIPARHQTLNEFLKLTTTLPFDRYAVINVAETNSEILRQCLLLVDLNGAHISQWHEQISDQAFGDLALLLGNSAHRKVQIGWQRGRLTQLLIQGLCNRLGMTDLARKRLELLASLLEVGHQELDVVGVNSVPRSELLDAERRRSGQTGADAGAEWLARRGATSADCDILKFQYEPLEVLAEASDDLFLLGLAGRVADAMLTSFELEASFFTHLESRCDLHSEMVHHLLEQAYMNLRIENDQILARSDFSERLALANLAQQFLASSNEAVTLDLAFECFGIHVFCVANLCEEVLELSLNGEVFSVDIHKSSSALAQTFND